MQLRTKLIFLRFNVLEIGNVSLKYLGLFSGNYPSKQRLEETF